MKNPIVYLSLCKLSLQDGRAIQVDYKRGKFMPLSTAEMNVSIDHSLN